MPATAPLFREIEGWRHILTREINAKNDVSPHDLNCYVGRLIQGFLFLRICEAREVEPGCPLRALRKGRATYRRLLELLRQGEKRNGAFFSRCNELDALVVPNRVIKSILSRIYHSTSLLTSEVLSIELLGRSYERFLEPNGAGQMARPVRKVSGIYYTPSYIIEAIVERTLRPSLEGRSPLDAEKVKILDPACGCGSFLLGACDWLFRWYLDWYLANDPQSFAAQIEPPLYKGKDSQWRLTPWHRECIVRDHLYGVDLDGGAVEVARLSLALKILEGAANYEACPLVPDLRENIKCGNSLIGLDFEVPALGFDWNCEFASIMENGGFDVVMGNPPYSNYSSRDSLRAYYARSGLSGELESLHKVIQYCAQKYTDSSLGSKDLYKWFTAKSLDLTRCGGQFGFIIPNTWLHQPKYADLKRIILGASGDLDILDLGSGVFSVTVPTCIVIARKGVGEVRRYADLKPCKDKPAALRDCQFKPLQSDGRAGEHPLAKRYLEEWPAESKLKNWLTLREGQHIRRAHLVAGSRKHHIAVIDSKNMGRYVFNSHPRYCYRNVERFKTTEGRRIIIRKTGDSLVAALTPAAETFVLQSLYQGVALHASLAPEYLLGLLNSKFLTFIYQNSEFGQKGRVLAQFRKSHLDNLPLPSFDADKHDLMVELVKTRLQAKEAAEIEMRIDALVYDLYGLNEEEIGLVEGGE